MSIFCFRGARNGALPPIDKSEFLESRPRGSAVSLLNTLNNILYSFIFIFGANQVRPFHSLINLSLLPAHILYIPGYFFILFQKTKVHFNLRAASAATDDSRYIQQTSIFNCR